jgi:lipid II:glycine glycyltransferase (peptidoglycan interpeptide bridge formation enzyme)
MPVKLEIINPLTYPSWDELVLSHENYSFFHTSHWAKVLQESYDYKPLYFSLINKGKLLFALPMMEVKDFLTGQRGVSLPFTDYCEPLFSHDIQFWNLFDSIINYGKGAKWEYIEIRGENEHHEYLKPSLYYYGNTLRLSRHEKKIFSHFRDSNKRNIKKAKREGVEVIRCNSLESIKDFYRLHCLTRKMHGIPPQPYSFFKKIFDYIISHNHGLVVLACYKSRVIAGAIYFHFGKKAIYKYGASERRYHSMRANNLVMWEAIKWYCQKGYKSFSFGRTDPDHEGLMQFKNGWGAKQCVIKYYKYDFKKNDFIKEKTSLSKYHNKIFHAMPISLLKIIGSLFYKHIG